MHSAVLFLGTAAVLAAQLFCLPYTALAGLTFLCTAALCALLRRLGPHCCHHPGQDGGLFEALLVASLAAAPLLVGLLRGDPGFVTVGATAVLTPAVVALLHRVDAELDKRDRAELSPLQLLLLGHDPAVSVHV